MTLDEQTLKSASKARDALIDLQHQTEVARVDYHHLVRQLHAKGGSLREIADALGLSHQRVHQIVEPVDGSAGGRETTRRGPGHEHGPLGHMHRLHRRFKGFMPFERFTEQARQVVMTAVQQSEELGHRRVGTEHLVLGVSAGPGDSIGARALAALGIAPAAVRQAVAARIPSHPATSGRRPFTPASRRSLQRALVAAKERGDSDIGAHHVLLGVLADGGDGAALLAELGADVPTLVKAIDDAAATVPPVGG